MWREELGIDIRLANKEWKTYLDTTQKMNYQIARAGWIGNLYPQSFLRIYTSNSSNNETGFDDPEFDRLIEEIFITMDQVKRYELIDTAEKRLLSVFPVIPIYWYTNVYLINERVKGWNPKLVDQRPYKLIDLVD
jgi:oligopeptide transport system substrate-binding protein